MCPTNDGIEETEHLLFLCSSLEVPRGDLLAGVSALLRPLGHTDLSNEFLMQSSLYGDKDFPDSLNKDIVKHQNCFRSNVKRTISPSGPQTHSKQKTANFS